MGFSINDAYRATEKLNQNIAQKSKIGDIGGMTQDQLVWDIGAKNKSMELQLQGAGIKTDLAIIEAGRTLDDVSVQLATA